MDIEMLGDDGSAEIKPVLASSTVMQAANLLNTYNALAQFELLLQQNTIDPTVKLELQGAKQFMLFLPASNLRGALEQIANFCREQLNKLGIDMQDHDAKLIEAVTKQKQAAANQKTH